MTERVLQFIGVTTGSSAIMKIFPAWAEYLGLAGTRLVGVDIEVGAEGSRYRQAVQDIRDDPAVSGALVTTHKLDVMQAAGDLFDGRDEFARLCNECSCIYRRGSKLIASAKDPITAGRTLAEMVSDGWFGETGGEVLCLGAGGAGVAITLQLLTAAGDSPARITVVDVDAERLELMRALHGTLPARIPVEYIHAGDAAGNDGIIGALPAGSLVVNATGMGKDRPGSPVTGSVVFPEHAIVWELNYRGELRFLELAQAQAAARELHAYDGWRYFIHGWSAVIEEVFALDLMATDIEQLSKIALKIRAEA